MESTALPIAFSAATLAHVQQIQSMMLEIREMTRDKIVHDRHVLDMAEKEMHVTLKHLGDVFKSSFEEINQMSARFDAFLAPHQYLYIDTRRVTNFLVDLNVPMFSGISTVNTLQKLTEREHNDFLEKANLLHIFVRDMVKIEGEISNYVMDLLLGQPVNESLIPILVMLREEIEKYSPPKQESASGSSAAYDTPMSAVKQEPSDDN